MPFILIRSILLVTAAVAVLGSPIHGAELKNAATLAERLQPLIDDFEGEVAVAIKDLESGVEFKHRADEIFPTASLIKLPIMIAAYNVAEENGLLDLKVTLKEEDKVPGSGILTSHFSEGATISLRDAIQLMIVYSDNTATNLVIDAIGLSATNEMMESLGCKDSQLNSKVFRRDTSLAPERSKKYGLGNTTANDMIKLLKLLHSKQLVSEAASEHMLSHLKACDDRTKIPRLLPPTVEVAHKTGTVSSSHCDAGLVMSPAGPIAICVLTDKIKDRSSENNAADLLCAKIAKEVFDYFNEGIEATDGQPILKVGAGGLLVEALQRTLNARLKPSPDIGIDGDFGPQTEQAVKAFQKFKHLPESGEVDAETWKALGTLVEEEEVPDPSIVNAEIIKKEPLEDINGPPVTTCKAWAIGDAETGKLLWGFNNDERRDIASATKIMTAYLVFKHAKSHPEILDEIIEFSQRADETEGSTAGVRTGERISVRELLYGLMLPSGNDASVALAEYFGSRLALANKKYASSYNAFIGAMNAAAEELGMETTHYENPNGLPEKGHQSCASDLLKLTTACRELPLFREYVSTPKRGCTVEGPGGYKRNLLWKNTNKLLGIEGYDGVKTGTTTAAGACLVSQATRGGKSLTIVVLGATSSDGRYVDSRNLYRWAWKQLDIP
jgi:serine-type D-Ala-D-Ala carboxypeptidase (penicillin-binding protein 5/6)